MKTIYFIPNAALADSNRALKVRMPDAPLNILTESGHSVVKGDPYYIYWQRRIADGSVVEISKAKWQKLQPKKTTVIGDNT